MPNRYRLGWVESSKYLYRKMTFKEELLALLRRHHVAFDERFLGD